MLEILNLRSVRPEGDARPFWAAELVNGTAHVPVDNRYGSWQADANGNRRGVLPAAAEQLQAPGLVRRDRAFTPMSPRMLFGLTDHERHLPRRVR
jgi:hypothetical protein